MLPKPLRVIWGDLTYEEVKKFSILASAFFIIMSVNWILKTLKDPIFDLYVGFNYQPWAKLVSLMFVGLSVIFYSKLIDLFKRISVYFIMCGCYGCSFLILALLLKFPGFVAVGFTSWIPGNSVGWACYLLIESFGSMMPALFWGFVASVTTTESAKRGYAMIITCAQVGTVIFPLLISYYISRVGLPIFFVVAGMSIGIVPFIIRFYNDIMGSEVTQIANYKGITRSTGFFQGARLLLTRPYLMSIFAVATLYEFVGVILDFQKGLLISAHYPAKLDGGQAFVWFKGVEGSLIGVVSILFAMFGTSFFMRRFGLRFCIMCFPTVISCVMIMIYSLYWFNIPSLQLIWIFLGATIIIKGLNYALNNPSKEVLYIPTSQDVKFKTKGWIDAFGARLLKVCGSCVNEVLKGSIPLLMSMGTLLSLGIIGIWFVAAHFVSTSFEDIIQHDTIVE